MPNMQLKARSNLRKQQDRTTPISTKRGPKCTAKTKPKYDFFGGFAHPEQAFTQDNAKWQRTGGNWRGLA
jgi:hypothetical protein